MSRRLIISPVCLKLGAVGIRSSRLFEAQCCCCNLRQRPSVGIVLDHEQSSLLNYSASVFALRVALRPSCSTSE